MWSGRPALPLTQAWAVPCSVASPSVRHLSLRALCCSHGSTCAELAWRGPFADLASLLSMVGNDALIIALVWGPSTQAPAVPREGCKEQCRLALPSAPDHPIKHLCVLCRLSTVRNADLTIVMADGRIAERGTHAALLIQQGIYAQLVRRQTDGGAPPLAEDTEDDEGVSGYIVTLQ